MSAGSDVILARMMSLHPKIIDLTLDRVWRLLAALDNPQDRLPAVIHLAGTNGKGSTQAMIRAGLEAAGQSVHAYTSPHLVRFHERIVLAGEIISEDALSEFLDRCYEANGGEPITYFEITTCAALLAFAETPADCVLLETGLGGRLDATNVVTRPALTVITPVDLDHQSYLGDTLADIAREKAGIIKRGVPCVVAPQKEAALEVIEGAADWLAAPLLVSHQHWHAEIERDRLIYQDETGLCDLPLPALPGPHQIVNGGTAVAALRALGFSQEVCEAAMRDAVWPGRMQRITTGALVDLAPQADFWLDGGHNPAAGAMLAATLAAMPPRPTYLVCGMLGTKDVAGYLRPLAAEVDGLVAVSIPGEAATLTAGETAKAGESVGMNVQIAADVPQAVTQVVDAEPAARILICGSLYLAGHVLREFVR